VRIAIVNDMRTAVEALRRVLLSFPNCELAWVADNGAEAVEKCAEDCPDLILMDIYMPVMDGVEATRLIMAASPCPILIVTASLESHSSKVFHALGAGALDAVKTPILGALGPGAGARELRVKIAAIGRLVADGGGSALDSGGATGLPPYSAASEGLVVIGSSAGGPAALATILESWPENLNAALVIVQHIDLQFAAPMVEWLGTSSALPVRVIHEGDALQAGIAYVAATDNHLIFRDSRTLGYTLEPHDSYYKPSIDIFFESVCRHWKGTVAAALLTGMGRDGAKGLKRLRTAGAFTVAQDRATSVVYGMPKAAVELDAALEILPLAEIGPRLVAALSTPVLRTRN
jgi:two-component system response regulator WspF